MRRRAFTAWDAALLVALLAGNFALLLPRIGAEGWALRAEILSDGGARILPLSRTGQVEVRGPLGVSRLDFGPQGVRFLGSPCPNQACVRSGWASRPGQIIACLPNRVAVRVFSGNVAKEEVDAVSR